MRIETVLLLNKRPRHSIAVLNSLVENGVEQVRAFMDYSDEPAVVACQTRLVETIRARTDIGVTLHRHSRKLGLAGSVRFAMQSALADADAAILLEDDCVVRPGGIDFFREALTELRDDPRIRSVCGYLFPCPFVREGAQPLLLRRFCSWGWATWRERWQEHEPNLRRVVEVFAERNIRIDEFAPDLAELCGLSRYIENRVDVWSVAWALEHFLTGTFTVYPSESMIDNIGFDGSGQNCPPTAAFVTLGRSQRQRWDWSRLLQCPENDEMLKRFMNANGRKIYPSS